MRVGQIFETPMPGSQFADVRDEFGNNRTTWAIELEEDDRNGDDFAYRVDFFKGGEVTLRNFDPPYGED